MAHRSVLPKGHTIEISNDTYTIERLISRGGTSLIYEATRPYCHNNHQLDLEDINVKRVILKELAPFDLPYVRNEKGMHFENLDILRLEEVFLGEIRNIANIQQFNMQLNHIPEMDTFGQFGGTWYIAMNHIKGHLLSHYLYEGGQGFGQAQVQGMCMGLNQNQILGLYKSMLAIVKELHSLPKPYLHLDLKPTNFIVGGLGDVFLFDFGSSLFTDEGWIKNYTERYSAPEVIYNQLSLVGIPSDIYSLGIIFLEMLSGIRPEFESVLLSHGHYYSPIEGAQDYNPILAKMLAPPPQDRYQTISEVLEALNSQT